MGKALIAVVATLGLAVATTALAATSFADRQGDNNPAPDITSVTLAERVPGTVELRVAVANAPTLPPTAWFNVWFDLDSNPDTGGLGDDALIRYRANGGVDYYTWDGARFIEGDASGIVGFYQAGVLTMEIPKSALDDRSSFGILVVSARSQNLSLTAEFIASDFAPDRARSAWAGPAEATFADPRGDHAEAPDITSVRVSDAKNGWVTFSISTPSHPVIPRRALLYVGIDADNRSATGEGGADVSIVMNAGSVVLRRWNASARQWTTDTAAPRPRGRSAGGVVTLEVHRSKIGTTKRFGFSVVSLDVDEEAEVIVAADVAPENGRFWRYALTNPAVLRLVAGKVTTTPVRPKAGQRVTIRAAVTRSDTQRAIPAGVVACNVRSAGRRVPATGRVRSGSGECTLVVPQSASAISGSMTVRHDGKAVTARFSFPVR